jgi:hypothetical protein
MFCRLNEFYYFRSVNVNLNCSQSLSKMKKVFYLTVLLLSNYAMFSQVGVGTTNPDSSSVFHVESTEKGILVPRLTTAQRNTITNPANGLFIFNVTLNLFEYNSGSPETPIWIPIDSNPTISSDSGNLISLGSDSGSYLSSTTYIGKFIVTGTGSQTITGLPFQPSQIKFSAYANIENYNINADNGIGNNNNTYQNAFGSMTGFATNYGGVINQQVIYVGGSGSSINDISRYASSSRAIGIRYSNNNGNNLGLTAAQVTSFNSDGFTLNITDHRENIVVIYEAYR